MFETFVFGTQIQTASACTHDDIAASPTDCSFTHPPSPQPFTPHTYKLADLSEIVHQFSQQSLCLHNDHDEAPQQSRWAESRLCTPTFNQTAMSKFTDEELSYVSTVHGRKITLSSTRAKAHNTTPTQQARSTVPCRRLQRQLNVQLQSCTSHIKDLHTLVEEMVATSSQCRLAPSPVHRASSPIIPLSPTSAAAFEDAYIFTTSSSPEPTTDEEYPDDFLALDEAISLRRASTPSGVRKVHLVRWTKSQDAVKACNALGQVKVRNVPRMRRRRMRGERCLTVS